MPRKKKTEEVPETANVNSSTADGDAAAELNSTAEAEDVKAEIEQFEAIIEEQEASTSSENAPNEIFSDSSDAVENTTESDESANAETEEKPKTPKKRKARKKADETKQEEEVSEPSEDSVEIEEEEKEADDRDAVLGAEEILSDMDEEEEAENEDEGEESENDLPAAFVSEEDVFSGIYEGEADESDGLAPADQEEKTAVELAQELKNLRSQRYANRQTGEANGTGNESFGPEVERISSAPVQRQRNEPQAAEFYGFSETRKDLSGVEETLMWSELRRFMYANIPIPCKIIAARLFNKEMCAICKPIVKKYSSVFIYVPFSEMDIPSGRELTTAEKRKLIERGRLNVVERVRITSVDELHGNASGSIRIGNRDTRKAAYFRGTEGRIIKSAEEQHRNIIGKGTVTIGYVQHINKDGIVVNIFGAQTRIKKSELCYEYIYHPAEKFSLGQAVRVKILDIQTSRRTSRRNDYSVTLKASVKAVSENKTIAALRQNAIEGHSYLAQVALLPGKDSNLRYPMAFAEAGFNISIGGSLTNAPYTEGSIVVIKLSRINKRYAFGHVVEVKEYWPQPLNNTTLAV